ncbi:MAG: hypothetical protein NWR72_00200 [Bacteroidia bacterium]|nr:hypothetical protein [Bacteroidia bacterium]
MINFWLGKIGGFLLVTTSGAGIMIYASVFFLSMLKFLVALLTAAANPRFGFWEVVIPAGAGALLSVVIYTMFGTQIRLWVQRNFKRKKSMSFARRRQIFSIWKKYGLIGISFLSIVLSPMISVGIAVSFQEDPRKIIFWNSLSIVFWTFMFATFRELVVGFF